MTATENLNKWDKRFIELANHVSTWSKDPRTKVGAVVVSPDRRVISLGYNGFPRGVEDTDERLTDRATKLRFVAHAERNALDNCDQNMRDCTMYVTLQPCAECTKSIIQRGIKRVICILDHSRPEYVADFVDYSAAMMQEAGVEVVSIDIT